ncbi:MAG: hypothetical protein ACRDA4_01010 [Filifactoraceae bacterium]
MRKNYRKLTKFVNGEINRIIKITKKENSKIQFSKELQIEFKDFLRSLYKKEHSVSQLVQRKIYLTRENSELKSLILSAFIGVMLGAFFKMVIDYNSYQFDSSLPIIGKIIFYIGIVFVYFIIALLVGLLTASIVANAYKASFYDKFNLESYELKLIESCLEQIYGKKNIGVERRKKYVSSRRKQLKRNKCFNRKLSNRKNKSPN